MTQGEEFINNCALEQVLNTGKQKKIFFVTSFPSVLHAKVTLLHEIPKELSHKVKETKTQQRKERASCAYIIRKTQQIFALSAGLVPWLKGLSLRTQVRYPASLRDNATK